VLVKMNPLAGAVLYTGDADITSIDLQGCSTTTATVYPGEVDMAAGEWIDLPDDDTWCSMTIHVSEEVEVTGNSTQDGDFTATFGGLSMSTDLDENGLVQTQLDFEVLEGIYYPNPIGGGKPKLDAAYQP